jgi:hypothetical protein
MLIKNIHETDCEMIKGGWTVAVKRNTVALNSAYANVGAQNSRSFNVSDRSTQTILIGYQAGYIED